MARRCLGWLLIGLIGVLTWPQPLRAVGGAAGGGAAGDEAGDEALLLDVYLNGRSIGRIGEFIFRNGVLCSTRGELRSLGLRVPVLALADRTAKTRADLDNQYIPLADLEGVTWRVDSATQTIFFKAGNERLLVQELTGGAGLSAKGHHLLDSAPGMLMNYDLSQVFSAAGSTGVAALDARQFSSFGVFSSGLLAYSGRLSPGRDRLVRLDSTFSSGNVDALRRFTGGDFITGSLAWSRPVRLEGMQVRSDFTLRPDLITFPLPSIAGSVAVPSSLQLLANGSQVLSSQVDTGPFNIPQVPVVSGAGTISMTLTDALGQQVRTTQPFYASPALLRPGLNSYSAEVGMTRRNWGVRSNDLGSLAASGTLRRGLSPSLTFEATGQATAGAGMGGTGAVMKLRNFAVLNLAAAASAGKGGAGAQLFAALQRVGPKFSFGASALLASAKFVDIATANGDPSYRAQMSANASAAFGRRGSLGLAVASLRQISGVTDARVAFSQPQKSRSLTASYSVEVHRLSFYTNAYLTAGDARSVCLLGGVVIPLRRRTSVNVTAATGGGYAQVQAQRSVTDVGDWGYQLFSGVGGAPHAFVEAMRKTTHGLVTAGIDTSRGSTTVRLDSQGSVSWLDRNVFFANRIQDSFAVVDTNGIAGVHVFEEQRAIGRSDRSGRLLVADLQSYQVNHLGISPLDLPPDVSLDVAEREVRPRDHSGVVVRFAPQTSHSALLTLVDASGKPLPVGSVARLQPVGEPEPVGYDGIAYVKNLQPRNQLRVTLPAGSVCLAAFGYVELPGTVPKIGPLPCL